MSGDAERLAEIRENLSTGINADPSCLNCNEHVLMAMVDRLTAERDEAKRALKTHKEGWEWLCVDLAAMSNAEQQEIETLEESINALRSERDAALATLERERAAAAVLRKTLEDVRNAWAAEQAAVHQGDVEGMVSAETKLDALLAERLPEGEGR